MINMQCVYLVISKEYTEKQVGILYLTFGLAQFFSFSPAGYLYDYTKKKRNFLLTGTLGTSIITVATVLLAKPRGENIGFMIFMKVLQGMCTALIPPGLNSITQGVVGYKGMTFQLSRNKMMNHLGTTLETLVASMLAYNLYPNLGFLFIISPVMMAFVGFSISFIRPNQIDDQAARGLSMSPSTVEANDINEEAYKPPPLSATPATTARGTTTTTTAAVTTTTTIATKNSTTSVSMEALSPSAGAIGDQETASSKAGTAGKATGSPSVTPPPMSPTSSEYDPSTFKITGLFGGTIDADPSYTIFEVDQVEEAWPLKKAPCEMLRDPVLVVFVIIIFLFHMSNTSVLPLVMQSLKLENEKDSIILSAMCICISQGVMIFVAKVCGDYSLVIGRKPLFLTGLYSLPLRCFILAYIINHRLVHGDGIGVRIGLLATEILDGVGAGFYFTLFILVTSDISASTGRFSLTLGVVVGAVALGGTVSGYLGEALAEDLGYLRTFTLIGFFSFIPALMYSFLMPETCPDSPFFLARQTIPAKKNVPNLV